LQANLLRKFLNYDEESRALINESKLTMAMSRDVGELVGQAFCKIPRVVSALTRLAMILTYQILTPQLTGKGGTRSFTAWVEMLFPVLLFPILMLTFLKLRNSITLRYLETQKESHNDLLHHVREVLGNYDLIRDYKKKGYYVELYEGKIRHHNRAVTALASIVLHNKKFAPWLTLCLIAAYTYTGGVRVAGDKLSLGEFLNNMAIYRALGQLYGYLYNLLLDMQNTFDALATLVEYLNLPIDVDERMDYAARNHELCQEALINIRKQPRADAPGLDPCDQLSLELKGVTFKYKGQMVLNNATCLKPSWVELPQGGLYTLVGPPSEGKGTYLRLLGGVTLPEVGGGDLMIPTHLRCLHVTAEPMFVHGTLLYNLTFGCACSDDSRLERVIDICKLLKLSGYIIEAIEGNSLALNWRAHLSATECSLLHIARSLIANPEILCIHKHTLFLNRDMEDTMYMVLKHFVENRGLVQDSRDFYRRRPRTCIVTARRVPHNDAVVVDAAYNVSREEGMQHMVRSDIVEGVAKA